MEKSKLKNIDNKKYLIIGSTIFIVVLIIVIGIFFAGDNSNESKKMTYEEYTIHEGHKGSIEKYDESMTVDGVEKTDMAYYIVGEISTKEDKAFSVITFNLYDKNDKVLGTAIAGVNDLEKNKRYKFKAISTIDEKELEKISYYKIKSVELG